jgi:hypothetical protein
MLCRRKKNLDCKFSSVGLVFLPRSRMVSSGVSGLSCSVFVEPEILSTVGHKIASGVKTGWHTHVVRRFMNLTKCLLSVAKKIASGVKSGIRAP